MFLLPSAFQAYPHLDEPPQSQRITTVTTVINSTGPDVRTAKIGSLTLTHIGGNFPSFVNRLEESNRNRITRLQQKLTNAVQLKSQLETLMVVTQKMAEKENLLYDIEEFLEEKIENARNDGQLSTDSSFLLLEEMLSDCQKLDPPREINDETVALFGKKVDTLNVKVAHHFGEHFLQKQLNETSIQTHNVSQQILKPEVLPHRQQFMDQMQAQISLYKNDTLISERLNSLYNSVEKLLLMSDEEMWGHYSKSILQDLETVHQLTKIEAELHQELENNPDLSGFPDEELDLILEKRNNLATTKEIQSYIADIRQTLDDIRAPKEEEEVTAEPAPAA